jgi:hypothetical protein
MNLLNSRTQSLGRTTRRTSTRPGVEGLEGRLAPSGLDPWGAAAGMSALGSNLNLQLIKLQAIVQRQQGVVVQLTTQIQTITAAKGTIADIK